MQTNLHTEVNAPSTIQMSNVLLAVSTGLPAAGKTTAIQQLNQNVNFSIVHICFDSLFQLVQQHYLTNNQLTIHQLSNSIQLQIWHLTRLFAYQYVTHILKQSHSSMERLIILIDDNMYYRSMRHVYYQLARDQRVGYVQLYFDVPLDVAIARNQQRSAQANHWNMQSLDTIKLNMQHYCFPFEQIMNELLGQLNQSDIKSNTDELHTPHHVTSEIIETMSNRMERPDSTKYNWERHSITINDGVIPVDFLLQGFQCIPPEKIDEEAEEKRKAECRSATLNDLNHQTDLQLRKVINEQMQKLDSLLPLTNSSDESSRTKQFYAQQWNGMRRNILTELHDSNSSLQQRLTELIDGGCEMEMLLAEVRNALLNRMWTVEPPNSKPLLQ